MINTCHIALLIRHDIWRCRIVNTFPDNWGNHGRAQVCAMIIEKIYEDLTTQCCH